MQTQSQKEAIWENWLKTEAPKSVSTSGYLIAAVCEQLEKQGVEDISPEILTEAAQALGLLTASVPPPPQKLFQMESDSRPLTHSQKEAARREEREKVTLAANDVNCDVFKAKNARDKTVYDDLIKNGPYTTTPGGRYDASRTEKRRTELQQIKPIIAKQRDDQGQPVIIYELMVGKVRDQLHRWEIVDSQW